MERKKVTELANQARSGGRALWARSSDPGIPKEGSALPARRDRAPPGPGFLAVKLQCERVAQLRSPRTCGRRSDWRRLERSPLQDCAARVDPKRSRGREGERSRVRRELLLLSLPHPKEAGKRGRRLPGCLAARGSSSTEWREDAFRVCPLHPVLPDFFPCTSASPQLPALLRVCTAQVVLQVETAHSQLTSAPD